jgi:hypothetical protein
VEGLRPYAKYRSPKVNIGYYGVIKQHTIHPSAR